MTTSVGMPILPWRAFKCPRLRRCHWLTGDRTFHPLPSSADKEPFNGLGLTLRAAGHDSQPPPSSTSGSNRWRRSPAAAAAKSAKRHLARDTDVVFLTRRAAAEVIGHRLPNGPLSKYRRGKERVRFIFSRRAHRVSARLVFYPRNFRGGVTIGGSFSLDV